MLWLILSLLTALAVASQDAWIKKHFSHLSAYDMLVFPFLFGLPLFLVTLPFVPVPPLNTVFYWSFLLSLPINFISFFIYMKAIRVSPLSLTLPYLAFTPAFMIFTGYVFLDEMPNKWGFAGILLTCIGGYVLNLEPGTYSVLEPIRAVFRETGSWLMLIVALIFAFGAVIGKMGILHSSPLFFTMAFFAVLSFMTVLVLLATGRVKPGTFRDEWAKGAGGRRPVFSSLPFPWICHINGQGRLYDIHQALQRADRDHIRRNVFQRKIYCPALCGCRHDGGRRGGDHCLGEVGFSMNKKRTAEFRRKEWLSILF